MTVKPKHLNRSQVAGCNIGHKPRPLHVGTWDMGQTSTHQIFSQIRHLSLKVVSIRLVFVQVFVFLINLGITIYLMLWTGSHYWRLNVPISVLAINGFAHDWLDRCMGWNSIPWRSLLSWLWLQMTSPVQDGSGRIQNILDSFLNSGRKWQRVVHLYIQSMEKDYWNTFHYCNERT